MKCYNCGQPGLEAAVDTHVTLSLVCPRCESVFIYSLACEKLAPFTSVGVVAAQAAISRKEFHSYEHS